MKLKELDLRPTSINLKVINTAKYKRVLKSKSTEFITKKMKMHEYRLSEIISTDLSKTESKPILIVKSKHFESIQGEDEIKVNYKLSETNNSNRDTVDTNSRGRNADMIVIRSKGNTKKPIGYILKGYSSNNIHHQTNIDFSKFKIKI